MVVHIVGAGWYGCHLAYQFKKRNIPYVLYDLKGIFEGSSSKNQNRLHLGPHYPRSPSTRQECQTGYSLFLKEYGHLCHQVPTNLYLLSTTSENLTERDDFSALFSNPPKLLHEFQTPFHVFQNIEPVGWKTEEQFIDPQKAEAFFKSELSYVRVEKDYAWNLSETDWLINCTYNHIVGLPFSHYELYCTLLYRIEHPELFALTVMDGPFFSIYPYDISKSLYTLTSVRHGVVWRGVDLSKAPTEIDLDEVRSRIEEEVLAVFPEFPTSAFHSHFLSWKTKPHSTEDDRSLRWSVIPDLRQIHLYGGKITGIFEAERIVWGALGLDSIHE